MKPAVHPLLQQALDSLEVPWEISQGSRHCKLIVNGVLCGVLPSGRVKEADRRAVLNTISQVRRAAAGVAKRRAQG